MAFIERCLNEESNVIQTQLHAETVITNHQESIWATTRLQSALSVTARAIESTKIACLRSGLSF
jgi:hypothetical protein